MKCDIMEIRNTDGKKFRFRPMRSKTMSNDPMRRQDKEITDHAKIDDLRGKQSPPPHESSSPGENPSAS